MRRGPEPISGRDHGFDHGRPYHIRVGLEDNIRVLKGKMAEGSWEQVEVAKRIVELADREVATPAEARKILNLKDRV